jgi:hypothetical protein
MKMILKLFVSLVLILAYEEYNICIAQTVTTGHVTAEVIESISASSEAVTSFALETTAGNSLQPSGKSTLTSTNINLGAMTLNSGNKGTVNVVLQPASMSNSQGNEFTLNPSLINNIFTQDYQGNTFQTIQLNGTAILAECQASGLYKGSITVVFACN